MTETDWNLKKAADEILRKADAGKRKKPRPKKCMPRRRLDAYAHEQWLRNAQETYESTQRGLQKEQEEGSDILGAGAKIS
jgi:hypothetical protein